MKKVFLFHILLQVALAFIAPSFFGSRVLASESCSDANFCMVLERSYIMIKPDGVQRGIVGDIISRFERRGYKLVALKLKQADRSLLEKHYKDLVGKPFFPKLMEYMTSGPVVAMVWEGKDIVSQGRKMLGATNPLESAPGTIRGDYSLDVGRNVCHGSDSVESANREIDLWFLSDEVVDHESSLKNWIYE